MEKEQNEISALGTIEISDEDNTDNETGKGKRYFDILIVRTLL